MATSVRTCFLALFLCMFASCIVPTIAGVHITYVAAPLIMLFYNASLATCLWAALISGLLLDAIEFTPKFGFLGLSFLLSCRILYPMRLYFFKDSLVTVPVMTFLLSFLAGCAEILVALFFDISTPKIEPGYVLGHLLLLASLDAVTSLVVFMLPTFLWHQYRVRISRRRYSDDS